MSERTCDGHPACECDENCVERKSGELTGKDAALAIEKSKVDRRIRVVFDGPPGAESGRFVETEDHEGKSFNAGDWVQRGDLWELRINPPDQAYIRSLEDENAELRALLNKVKAERDVCRAEAPSGMGALQLIRREVCAGENETTLDAVRGIIKGLRKVHTGMESVKERYVEVDAKVRQRLAEYEKERLEGSGPDWCCADCGSRDHRGIVYPSTPNGPEEYDMECNICGSLNIAESCAEAASELGDKLDTVTAERDGLAERLSRYKEAAETACVAMSLRHGYDQPLVDGYRAVQKEYGGAMAVAYKYLREALEVLPPGASETPAKDRPEK